MGQVETYGKLLGISPGTHHRTLRSTGKNDKNYFQPFFLADYSL